MQHIFQFSSSGAPDMVLFEIRDFILIHMQLNIMYHFKNLNLVTMEIIVTYITAMNPEILTQCMYKGSFLRN